MDFSIKIPARPVACMNEVITPILTSALSSPWKSTVLCVQYDRLIINVKILGQLRTALGIRNSHSVKSRNCGRLSDADDAIIREAVKWSVSACYAVSR